MSKAQSRWNSFNSAKALVHVNYWRDVIDKDIIPPPLFVSVDPCGVCNLRCHHCNAAEILRNDDTVMNKDRIDEIMKVLIQWDSKCVCVGGGGEPLMNKNSYYLIDRLKDANIQSALVTNGTTLGDNLESLLKLDYMGISVDAASNKVWQAVKGSTRFTFDDIIRNISKVTGKGLEVTYKYLLLESNYTDVYEACRIAKDIGCEQFHLRPAAPPWFEMEKSYNYTPETRSSVSDQLEKAKEDFQDENFQIYGVMTKFTEDWKVGVNFKRCWACLTTCAVSPDGTVTLCCDRRGDSNVELGNIKDMHLLWGNDKHRQIQDDINVHDCPRCTFGHVNEIFEQVILNNSMKYNFF